MNRTVVGRLARLVTAVALAVPVLIAPTAASPVAAAGSGLTLVGTARYVVQPERHRVQVTVDLSVTNRAPETVTSRYVYDRANLAVLPGATGFHATENGARAGVSVAARSARSTLVAIRFAKRLGSGRTTTIRLGFVLPDPGGKPSRQVRVGPSLVAFPVWAFGTKGVPGSSVSVRFPAGYKVTVGAGRLGKPTTEADGTSVVSSGTLADPFALSGYVLADRAGAFAETPLDVPLDGAVAHLAVRAWKDDPTWSKKTAGLLRKALPALSETIGLAYPQESTIAVEEAVSRSIDGLAGVYDPSVGTIRLAYTAGPAVVLHEAAHLWFDGTTFADRWMVEGLATYAALGAADRLKLGKAATRAPAVPDRGAFPLNAWAADPGRGADVEADEAYGYAASTELIRLIAARTGADGFRAVLRAAAAQPAGTPTDWRGFLDLIESDAGVDATDLWRTWVVRPEDAALLDARALARFDRARLIEEATGWQLPASIDAALRTWRFADATTAMTQARTVIDARDDLAVAAAVAGLQLPPTLRQTFETGDLEAAAAEASVERAIVDQIVAAEASGAATSSSWLVRFGLLGQDPVGELVAARVALAAGDLSAAQARAIGARETWTAAADLGGLRLRTIAAIALVVALVVLLMATRARRHPRRADASYET